MSEITGTQNENKKKSIFEHILAICGYVLFCILLMIAAGVVFALGAGAAALIAGIVLIGAADVFGGLVLIGVGAAHIFSLPRASLINLGGGMYLVAIGILTELFLFWFALDVVPWVTGKIRKRPPRVMAKDIRALVIKVLKGGIAVIAAGMFLVMAGALSGGVVDIRNQTVTALKETREAMEDTIDALPFSDRIRNLELLSFEYTDWSLELSFAENAEKYRGNVSYTVVEDTEEINRIKISALSGRLDIRMSPNGDYAFESKDSGEYQVFTKEGILFVTVYPYLHRYEKNEEPQVILYLPKDCYVEDLDIYFSGRRFRCDANLSGKEMTVLFPQGTGMDFAGLDFREIKLQNGFGEFNADRVSADLIYADVGSGEMNLNGGDVKDVKANISSGKFRFFGTISKKLEICCGTGRAYVEPDSEGFRAEDYSLYLTGTPASMQIGEQIYKDIPLYEYQKGNTDRVIKADVRGGNVTVW